MKKRTKFGLMKFLAPSDEPISFLVVESLEYLPLIRRAFPNAKLAAVTENEDAPREKEWEGLNVSWEILDYTVEPLPFPKESFDYILSEHLLELGGIGAVVPGELHRLVSDFADLGKRLGQGELPVLGVELGDPLVQRV